MHMWDGAPVGRSVASVNVSYFSSHVLLYPPLASACAVRLRAAILTPTGWLSVYGFKPQPKRSRGWRTRGTASQRHTTDSALRRSTDGAPTEHRRSHCEPRPRPYRHRSCLKSSIYGRSEAPAMPADPRYAPSTVGEKRKCINAVSTVQHAISPIPIVVAQYS